MSRGHGAPGLVDNLRTFSDLVDDSAAARRPYLEFFPGASIPANAWVPYQGGPCWQFNGLLSYVISSVALDVVGVETPLGALVRVETLAECVLTPGTFYAVENLGEPPPFNYDDGASTYDSGLTYDHQSAIDLWVHLATDANPNLYTIVPLLGYYASTRGEVHPALGPEKLQNGGFESLVGWTEVVAGAGFTTAQDLVLFTGRGSAASLKLVSTGGATGNASRYQDRPTILGATYRLAGAYQTSAVFSPNLVARLLVGDTGGTKVLYADGRDGDASGQAVLTPTGGDWRQFIFDLLAPAATTRIQAQLRAASSAGAGQVNFDGLSFRRIYRYVLYDGRLGDNSIPEVEVASQSIFFAGKTHGQGAFALIDTDGALQPAFSTMLLHNKPATVYIGGAFADGQEVYRSDWRAQWPGLTAKPEWDDRGWKFQADDARARFDVDLAAKVYDPTVESGSVGKARPLIFAADSAGPRFKPVRVGTDPVTGYGIYEVADVTDALAKANGSKLGTAISVYSYPSDDCAARDVARLGLTPYALVGFSFAGDYTWDPTTGRLAIKGDVRNILRDGSGISLEDFVIKVKYTATTYKLDYSKLADRRTDLATPEAIAGAITFSLLTSTGNIADWGTLPRGLEAIGLIYTHSTHKFTFYRNGAGVFELPLSAGAAASGLKYLGFTSENAYTGATSYTSDVAVFEDPDKDHHIRVSVAGFVDDDAGTITGISGGQIVKQADMARYVLQQYAKVPTASIDAPSFSTGRGPDGRAFLDQVVDVSEFLTRCERGAMANIIIDADGVWRWRPYIEGATPVRDFYDRDFLEGSFGMWQDTESIFSYIRLQYGRNPQGEEMPAADGIADTGIAIKHGRAQFVEWVTWLDSLNPAAVLQLALRYARLSAAVPWLAKWSARGKLADTLIGDVVTVTRSRSPKGPLVAARFRLLSLRHDGLAGVSTCLAVEDVPFMN